VTTKSKLAEGLGVYVRNKNAALFAYQDTATKSWLEVNAYDNEPPGPKYKLAFGKAGEKRPTAETVCPDLPALMNTAEFACAVFGWSDQQRLHMVKCMIGRLCWEAGSK
jgi:pantothenate synthetase